MKDETNQISSVGSKLRNNRPYNVRISPKAIQIVRKGMGLVSPLLTLDMCILSISLHLLESEISSIFPLWTSDGLSFLIKLIIFSLFSLMERKDERISSHIYSLCGHCFF